MELFAPVIAWVDDIAIPISCLYASQLDGLLSVVMQQLHMIFGQYGLRINSDKGKTEAIINYRGPDAAQLRRQRFIDDFGMIEVPGRAPLRIVTQYLHLGISIAQCCDIKLDVRAKIGKASNAYRLLSKPIFANKKIPVAVRLRLLESLVLPIVFYGAGSWPLLSARTFATLSSVITSWQRRIIGDGFWKDTPSTDQELRAQWKLPDLAVRLAKHRLLFLLQLRHHGPTILWDFITAADLSPQSSWLMAVRPALRWLHDMTQAAEPSNWTSSAIVTWAFAAPSSMPRTIRHAVRRHLMQEHIAHQVLAGHREIKHLCVRHGVSFDEVPHDRPPQGLLHSCHVCYQTFSTIQGLSAHLWRKHQQISAERQFVFTSTCLCCQRCFWTAQRLQQHIRYSRRYHDGCFWWLQEHVQPQLTSTPIALPDFFHGQHRLPWTLAQGPSPVSPVPLWERSHADAWAQWQEEWRQAGFPEDIDEDICHEVHRAMTACAQQWATTMPNDQDLAFLWTEVVAAYECQDEPIWEMHAIWAFGLWGRVCLYDLLDSIEDPDVQLTIESTYLDVLDGLPVSPLLDRLERLHRARPPEPQRDPPAVHADRRVAQPIEPLHGLFDNLQTGLAPFVGSEVLAWPTQPGIPVCQRSDGSLVAIICHLFSGRRRVNDCHHWIEQLWSHYFPDIEVIILSLDTAVCGDAGNLLHGPGFDSFQRILELGVVLASLSGPPCETWSAARHLVPPSGSLRRWPRPLRSADRPWGLPHLRLKELEQLAVGSQLMLSNVKIELHIVLRGGAAIMEHPSQHSDADYASVWRTSLQTCSMWTRPWVPPPALSAMAIWCGCH